MSERRPTVAVVMATYNRAHFIGAALDSLLGQTRVPDEIHVIDDGSTDDTAATVAAYGDRVNLAQQPNQGRPAAFNRVIPEIRTDYIWLFDDDDLALPDALARHLDFLGRNPQYDFSYSPHYFFEHTLTTDGAQANPVMEWPADPPESFLLWLMESHFVPAQLQGMLIPTRCFRQVGSFDETLLRSQDHDFLLRLARHGRAGRIDAPTWAFRQHRGQRGAGGAAHDEASRYHVWRQYQQTIYRRVRATLDLAEYLPPSQRADVGGPAEASPPPGERRLALLRRGAIMSIHGLPEAAVEDFRLYGAVHDPADARITEEERTHISRLGNVDNRETRPPLAYFRTLGRLAHARRGALSALLRGAYWSVRREWRAGRYGDVVVLAPTLMSLCLGYGLGWIRRPSTPGG